MKNSQNYWIFFNEQTLEYIAVRDKDLTGELRWQIEDKNGFILLCDGANSVSLKEYIEVCCPGAKQIKYEIEPITLREAQNFVEQHHRHHKAPQGHKFSIGLRAAGQLIGVIIAGRPVSRYMDDTKTLEVTRCALLADL